LQEYQYGIYNHVARNVVHPFGRRSSGHWFYTATFGDWQLPANWHGELAEFLVRGTPDEAYAAMRRHVRVGLDRILQRLELQSYV